jgi:hypothetical protein
VTKRPRPFWKVFAPALPPSPSRKWARSRSAWALPDWATAWCQPRR